MSVRERLEVKDDEMPQRCWTVLLLSGLLTLGCTASGDAAGPDSVFAPSGPAHMMPHPGMMPPGPHAIGPGPAYGPPMPQPGGLPQPFNGPISTPISLDRNGDGIPDVPANSLPWPKISPYEHRYEQLYNEDGLWKQFFSNQNREWHTVLTATALEVSHPEHAPVGVPSAVFEDLSFGEFGPVTLSVFEDSPADIQADTVGERSHEPDPLGFRILHGFEDPDGSGMMVDVWWTVQARWIYARGIGSLNPTPATPRITHSVPLHTGDGVITPVPYDQLFRLEYTSTAFGAGIHRQMTKWLGGKVYRVRPSYGFRYMYIREEFEFTGIDSGASYTVDPTTGVGDPGSYVQIFPPYRNDLANEVESHIFGPQIGLEYELGGESLLITGASRVGVGANFHGIELSGNAVGDGFGDPNFRQDAPFSDTDDHTSFSPMFEQYLGLEVNLVKHMPVLNRIHALENARIVAGYWVLAATEVTRPENIIDWNGLPLFPEISGNTAEKRQPWYQQGWTVGFHWTY